jgi:hypothetical protein
MKPEIRPAVRSLKGQHGRKRCQSRAGPRAGTDFLKPLRDRGFRAYRIPPVAGAAEPDVRDVPWKEASTEFRAGQGGSPGSGQCPRRARGFRLRVRLAGRGSLRGVRLQRHRRLGTSEFGSSGGSVTASSGSGASELSGAAAPAGPAQPQAAPGQSCQARQLRRVRHSLKRLRGIRAVRRGSSGGSGPDFRGSGASELSGTEAPAGQARNPEAPVQKSCQ